VSDQSPEPTRPICVYHVAAMGDWQAVVREQLGALADAGFGATPADPVRVTFVGRGLDWLQTAARDAGVHAVIVRADENVNHYETFAIIEVERLAKADRTDRPILYLHTKGVSAAGDLHKRRWRVLMEEFVVRGWRECVAALAGGHDVAGVGFWGNGEPHFSGNFWIASPDWLRGLPDFVTYHHAKGLHRYTCELWIGARGGMRPFECFHSNQQFWQNWYDLTGHLSALTRLPDATPEPTEAGLAARPLLVVVTAVSRPERLTAVGYSLRPLERYFRVRWVLVADEGKTTAQAVALGVPEFLREWMHILSAPPDGFGIAQKNTALECVAATYPDGWVYTLDDDNAVHPAFPAAAAGAVRCFAAADVLVFGQATADGSHRLDAGPVEWGKIDTASYLVRAAAVGDARYRRHAGAIGDDYQFISQIFKRIPERFRYVHRRCTYHNKLPPNWTFTKHCPVPLHQHAWEFTRLVGEVSLALPDGGTVVEIGSLYGGTLWHWLHMGLVDRVLSIDLPPRPSDPWFCPVLHGAFREHCRSLWEGWAERRGATLGALDGDSHRPDVQAKAAAWLGGPGTVDFLWIDGDHSTDGVFADYRDYLPLVKPGGLIAFHDIHGLPDVARAWQTIKAGHKWTEYGEPGGWGIGIVQVDNTGDGP
jgi:cephalosporin hydroxylase